MASSSDGVPHGTSAGYSSYGYRCRCGLCRQWNAERQAERRRRIKTEGSAREDAKASGPKVRPMNERDRARFRAADAAFPDETRRT